MYRLVVWWVALQQLQVPLVPGACAPLQLQVAFVLAGWCSGCRSLQPWQVALLVGVCPFSSWWHCFGWCLELVCAPAAVGGHVFVVGAFGLSPCSCLSLAMFSGLPCGISYCAFMRLVYTFTPRASVHWAAAWTPRPTCLQGVCAWRTVLWAAVPAWPWMAGG